MTATELPLPTHADRLAEAAATTAAARQHVDDHAALAADVADLKLRAAGGDLDDKGAAELLRKAEALRLAEITETRRRKALDDALAAEVRVALDVLADLGAKVDGLAKEAATAADLLTAALVDPAAAAIRSDTRAGHERETGRCAVESYMPGVFTAAVLADRIKTASQTSWGSGHVAAEAREIVATFDAELAAIRSGIDGLKAVHKAALKVFA